MSKRKSLHSQELSQRGTITNVSTCGRANNPVCPLTGVEYAVRRIPRGESVLWGHSSRRPPAPGPGGVAVAPASCWNTLDQRECAGRSSSRWPSESHLRRPHARRRATSPRHVDPMIGTCAARASCSPGAAVPFGMVQNSPDTRGEFAYSGYLYTDPTIRGLQPRPPLGPGREEGRRHAVHADGRAGPLERPEPSTRSPFDHATRATPSPATTACCLDQARDRRRADRVDARRHAALHVPAGAAGERDRRRGAQRRGRARRASFELTGPDEISGWAEGRYPVYFVATLQPAVRLDRQPFAPTARGGWVRLRHDGRRVVTARSASRSWTSRARGATWRPRRRRSTSTACARGRARRGTASSAGSRSSGGTDLERTSFYTALYHALLHPNVFTDVDGRYLRLRRARSTRPTGAPSTRTSRRWDLYKARNQLLAADPAAALPRHAALAAAEPPRGRAAAALGRAVHRRRRTCRGDPAIPMIADGVCRAACSTATRAEALLRRGRRRSCTRRERGAARSSATCPDRPGTTLEYGVADFALALLADALGPQHDARAGARRLAALPQHPRPGDAVDPARATPTGAGTSRSTRIERRRRASRRATRGSTRGSRRTTRAGCSTGWAATPAVIERLDHDLHRCRPRRRTGLTFFGIVYRLAAVRAGQRARPPGAVDVPLRRAAVEDAGRAARAPAALPARRSTACPATTTSAGSRRGTPGRCWGSGP